MWVAQGDVYKSLGRIDEAVKCYERGFALSQDPMLLRELALLFRDKFTPPRLAQVSFLSHIVCCCNSVLMLVC